jgi:SAM-dependent methyltransferase
VRPTSDTFGAALVDWAHGGTIPEIIERDDGVIEIGAGPEGYLAPFNEWPSAERQSMRSVRGRVLDVGCGAGRVVLYLQQKGIDAAGVDSSSLALRAAKLHGVKKTWCATIDDLDDRLHEFETLVFFGNNLGIFGTPVRARRILTRWSKVMPLGARILMESTNPFSGGAPVVDRAYCANNRTKGITLGQCRLRVWYDQSSSKWFSWFFVSRTDLQALLRGTGWRAVKFFSSAPDEPYVALLERE